MAAKHYHVKEALDDWDVLRDIAKEVKGKGEVSNDLTRWAAASALEAIGYSRQSLENLQGGGFTEPLDRIRREIRDRKLVEINRIPRLNTRGETTAEYERHLEFWIYGPADELLNDNDRSLNYQDLIGDVISKLHGRGVYLGLISPNSIVQEAALRQAELIFKESAEIEDFIYGLLEEFLHNSNNETSLRIKAAEIINTATDVNRRLKNLSKLLLEERNPKLHEVALRQAQSLFKPSAEIEDFIYGLLEEFLHNSNNEIALRIKAAEIINTATDLNRRVQTLSKLLLEETNPKLHEVALRQAQSVFHHYAEDFIYGLLEEFLANFNNEIALRIYAAEIINTTTDLSRRLKTLSQLLLEKIELRNAAVRLLTPYKQELVRVEPDADTILKALVFSYSLNTLQKPQLQDLTISQLETYFSSASQDYRKISELFTSAITTSESLAQRYGRSVSVLKQFLQNKQDEYLSAIESWLQVLRHQISETETEQIKVKSNQILIKEVIEIMTNLESSWASELRLFPLPENVCVCDANFVLYTTEFHTYNQIYKIQMDLKSIKEYIKKNQTIQSFLNPIVSSKTALDDLFKTLYQLRKYDLNLSFQCGFNDTQALLIVLYYALLIVVPVFYGWAWLGVILIVTIGIRFPFVVRYREKTEKNIKDIQSLIYKLNTQWKE
ncbi:hypothetical protein [Microcoleus sp. S13_C5]|uniref:hypothetical protein n=1 Tax=Microcoleus sp. S13_C5 TaxID=3055411 RepID=UPI002FCFB6A4